MTRAALARLGRVCDGLLSAARQADTTYRTTCANLLGERDLEYEAALVLGDIGEKRVSDTLRAEARALGYEVLDNILLDAGDVTAQFDHIVIDKHGLLVVETKNYSALVRGRSADRTWTSCYRGRRPVRFLNPLLQNDRHREILHRVFRACGRDLPPEYVQSLIVFAGGDIDHLQLNSVDSMRVIRDAQLADFVRDRYSFAPNHGALDVENTMDLVSLLASLDRSHDPDVVARHSEAVQGAHRRLPRLRAPRHTALAPASPATRTIFNQHYRYPDGSHDAPPPRRSVRPALRQAFVLLVLLGIAGWLFFDGGLAAVDSGARDLMRLGGLATQVTSLPPQTRTKYDIALAEQRLEEADPALYSRLSSPHSPRLSVTRGMSTYTWDFVEKVSAARIRVRSISITLRSDGNIAGVSQQ